MRDRAADDPTAEGAPPRHQAVIPHSRPSLQADDLEALAQVVQAGQLAQGPAVARFERAMAAFLGRAGGVAVSSGTAALELALRALGVGPGDEVLMPSYVCAALWLATTRVGAQPRLVDIRPDSYNLDPDHVDRARTTRTRAVIVPHLFGTPADLTRLRRLGLPLIEDCAQTLGATRDGVAVGSAGTVTVCSFYATKLLCTGEGGMLLSDDEGILELARAWREYDQRPALVAGAFNYKMTDLQAALGLRQLDRLPAFLARRAAIAGAYDQGLRDRDVVTPAVPHGATHAYYRYVVRVPAAEGREGALTDLLGRLERRGVHCRRPVFQPLHRSAGLPALPRSEAAFHSALSIPLYPSLTDAEVARALEAVRKEVS